MSAQDLAAALSAAEGDNSHRRLYELTEDPRFTELAPPSTALSYLRVFCDPTQSAARRRWVGLTFRKMVEASPAVVEHLKTQRNHLSRLGQTILRTTELEETRTVAGLIIRQALEKGLDFTAFWTSDKVPNNAPFFPREDGSEWMTKFQQYLDDFEDLKMTHPTTIPAVLYFTSITTSDGFKWFAAVTPIAIIQDGLLTVIILDQPMLKFDFVDVPLRNIQAIKLCKAILHDSQSRESEYEPWKVDLSLKPGHCPYYINALERTGTMITIIFGNSEGAEQFQYSLQEAGVPFQIEPQLSSSQGLLSLGHTSRDQDRQQTPKTNIVDAERGPPILEKAMTHLPLARSASMHHQRNDTAFGNARARDEKNGIEQISLQDSIEVRVDGATSSPIPIRQAINDKSQDPGRPGASISNPGVMGRTGALRAAKKNWRPSNGLNGDLERGSGEDNDEFGFPNASPWIRRTARQRKQVLKGQKVSSAAIAHRSSQKSEATVQSTNPKPNVVRKSKSTATQQMNVIEDEAVSIGPTIMESAEQPGITAEPKLTVDSTESDLFGKEGRGELSNLDLEPPNISKLSKRTIYETTGEGLDANDNIANTPSDDSFTQITRKRRKVAKNVNYNENESSIYGSSGSEYVATKSRNSRLAQKQVSPLKEGNPNKGGKALRAKPKGGSRKIDAKAHPPSPIKHTVLSSLLSGSKVTSKSSSERGKGSSKAVTQVADSHATTAKKQSAGVLENLSLVESPAFFLSEAGILEQFLDDEMDAANAHPTSSPLAGKTKGHPDISLLEKTPEFIADNISLPVSKAFNEAHHQPDAPQRKRAADSAPATPRIKRARTNHAVFDGVTGTGQSKPQCSQTTVAPVRVLEEPSSPCANIKRFERGIQRPNISEILKDSGKNAALQVMSPLPRHGDLSATPAKQVARRLTPLHQPVARNHSGGFSDARILSSNSKPLPAAPSAPSTAISGHTDTKCVEAAKLAEEIEAAKSNPFAHNRAHKITSFTRRLTNEDAGGHNTMIPSRSPNHMNVGYSAKQRDEKNNRFKKHAHESSKMLVNHSVDEMQASKRTDGPYRHADTASITPFELTPEQMLTGNHDDSSKEIIQQTPQQAIVGIQLQLHQEQHTDDLDKDAEETLVAHKTEPEIPAKPSLTHVRSSPAVYESSSSSHSSTSAEPEPDTTPEDSFTTDQAEEMEWEASLQPHQLAIRDQLFRVSKRLLRHVVDNETAVSDVTETYDQDGKRLLKGLQDNLNDQYTPTLHEVRRKKLVMKLEFERLAKKLSEGRGRL